MKYKLEGSATIAVNDDDSETESINKTFSASSEEDAIEKAEGYLRKNYEERLGLTSLDLDVTLYFNNKFVWSMSKEISDSNGKSC